MKVVEEFPQRKARGRGMDPRVDELAAILRSGKVLRFESADWAERSSEVSFRTSLRQAMKLRGLRLSIRMHDGYMYVMAVDHPSVGAR